MGATWEGVREEGVGRERERERERKACLCSSWWAHRPCLLSWNLLVGKKEQKLAEG